MLYPYATGANAGTAPGTGWGGATSGRNAASGWKTSGRATVLTTMPWGTLEPWGASPACMTGNWWGASPGRPATTLSWDIGPNWVSNIPCACYSQLLTSLFSGKECSYTSSSCCHSWNTYWSNTGLLCANSCHKQPNSCCHMDRKCGCH